MRKLAFLILFLLGLLLAAAPVAAAQLESGESVVIGPGEVRNDDVIAGAGTFRLEGRVRGDLIVFGRDVTIAPGGVVEGDLIAAGRSVVVEGSVMDDARLAGAVLTVGAQARIGDDLIAAGQSLETKPGSAVDGALIFGGGQGLLAGDVAQEARLGAGGIELRGRIGGDVHLAVGEAGTPPAFSPLAFLPDLPPTPQVTPGLTLREGARIGGSLDYVAPQEAVFPAGAVAGKVTHRAVEPASARPSPARMLAPLRTFAALAIVGLLALWLAPATLKGGAAALSSRPGASFGWGVAGFFAAFLGTLAIVLGAVLAAVVLGGLSLGDLTALAILGGVVALLGFLLAFAVAAFYLSKVVVAFLGGRLLLARLKPAWAERRVAPLLVGVLLLALLGALPVLGGPIHLLAALFGLGALWLLARERFRRRPALPALPEMIEPEAPLQVAA